VGTTPSPSTWFLTQAAVWGNGTSMATRAQTSTPWDTGCTVTPLIGGFAAMESIRISLESAIQEASGNPPGQCGYVYVAGWRIDPLRDLSSANSWGTGRWGSSSTASTDETAIGLFLRVLQAGIKLRILVWTPTHFERLSQNQHFQESYSLYQLIQEANQQLMGSNSSQVALGIVGLDMRIGAIAGTHHQKMIVIRGAGSTQVAYCGGVDLAFTRRDAPPSIGTSSTPPQFNAGDWQSGSGMPVRSAWPEQSQGLSYPPKIYGSNTQMQSDLPELYYGTDNQVWHDQYLMLQGPIISTLETQFRERWMDPVPTGNVYTYDPDPDVHDLYAMNNTVLFSDGSAVANGQIVKLELLDAETIAALPPLSSTGSSNVQMWRTIPVRPRGSSSSLFSTGEFSNLSGIANACEQASELIWIFDQYFWSLPLARLLNRLLMSNPSLCLIIVLPPYPDTFQMSECYLRLAAILELTSNFGAAQYQQLEIYNLWNPNSQHGIYCHAKVQIYDGSLLVCGSCNLNQRSLLCDSEIACAVLDPTVVASHQNNLWQLLFSSAPSSPINIGSSGTGAAFLTSFRTAASSPGSFLVEDEYYYSRWKYNVPDSTEDFGTYSTPSGWKAPAGYSARAIPSFDVPGRIIEPSSLKKKFPSDPRDISHPLGLDVISNYLTTPPKSTTYRGS
jgi:phosphatidylserine/phosphatidylglycerophosphate/cardiolipin synthase-like enzyme